MKKGISLLLIILSLLSFTSCATMNVSTIKYIEISNYVSNNLDNLYPESDEEFYTYDTSGLSIGGVYYGYYYSEDDDILLPDYYGGNDYDIIKNDTSESRGGTFFGKPNNGTDWCFVKEITDHWYYYELHWA